MSKVSIPDIIADLLLQYGVRNVVVSPGSRNAPLIEAICRREEFKIHTVVDERVAAFIALGIAIQKNEPVTVVCTSGTAVLNYGPAVAEAFYRRVPLIVLSADRPARWVDQNDGQTIRQYEILKNVVVKSVDIDTSETVDNRWYANRLVNEALIWACHSPKGPVHINVHLESPRISGNTEKKDISVERKIDLIEPLPYMTFSEVKNLARGFTSKKIMVVIGSRLPDSRLNKALSALSTFRNVVIVAEAQSNIRGVKNTVDNFDALYAFLTPKERADLYPDLVISIGGDFVSRSLKEWLRNAPSDLSHWAIETNCPINVVDCFKHLDKILHTDAASFLKSLSSALRRATPPDEEYAGNWNVKNARVQSLTAEYVEAATWCDLKAVSGFFENLFGKVNVHISNGLAVRYAQLARYDKASRIDCNRGCSGIEGSTSTAVGAALVSKVPVILLTGDMSAHYDLGALCSGLIPKNFSIFVLNNGGGDIFRYIEATRNAPFREECLSVNRSVDFCAYAECNGFKYAKVTDSETLHKCVGKACKGTDGPYFFEIDTRNINNSEILRQYFKFIQSSIINYDE